jgi:thiosulfate/3-mercaptopyruvate sulfurtransferase
VSVHDLPLSLFMQHPTSPLIPASDIPLQTGTVILDARSGADAHDRYLAGHLQGALHVDLDKTLTKLPENPAYGGRHPLPPIGDFAASLGSLGISPSTDIVVYDDKYGANAAARLWWMLRAVGHQHVRVVDGGLAAIIHEGLPMTSVVRTVSPAPRYPVQHWVMPTVSIEEVANASSGDSGKLIVDVREAYRYRGESEPIDLVAGHIPGAINIPYLENLTPDGAFRPAEELASRYNNAIKGYDPADVVVHCGSGVTACHTLLALEQAGIHGASLYVGSWSEWSRRDQPMDKSV